MTLFASAALALTGCGSSAGSGSGSTRTATSTPAAGTSTAQAAQTVQIKGFAFSPAMLTVSVGTTVTWNQDDSTVHTVTDQGAFDSGTLAHGASWSHTFTKAGTYAYICSIHAYMTGTVVVQ